MNGVSIILGEPFLFQSKRQLFFGQVTKSMVDYAPAEISALEQYEMSVKEQAIRRAVR